MKHRATFSALVLAAAVGTAGGEEPRTIDLAWALDRALAQNLDLALARAEEDAARARRRTAVGSLLPFAEAGAGIDREQQGAGALLSFDPFDPQVSGVYRANPVEATLRVLGRTSELDAAALAALDVRQRLLARVATLYQDLLLARAALAVSEEVLGDGERFLAIARAREASGIAAGDDVARAEAQLAAGRQQLIRAREGWERTSVRLSVVLRESPSVLLAPRETEVARLQPELPRDAAAAEQQGLRERPDLRAARERAGAAGHAARAAWWNLLAPEVRAEARETWVEGDPVAADGRRFDAGVLFRWTIGFEQLGRISEGAAARRAAELRAEALKDEVRAAVAAALRAVAAGTERLAPAAEGLRAAERSLRLSEARYQAGTALGVELLDASRALARARLDMAESLVAYNRAQIELLVATGRVDGGRLVGQR